MSATDPLEQQINAFAQYLADERRASARTVETYIRDLRSFRDYVRDEGLPADARKLDIVALRGFLASLFGSNQASTMKKKVSAIRSLFKFLLKRHIIEQNPAAGLRSPKIAHSLPRFLTVEQAFRVMEAPPKEERRAKPLKARDQALLETLYSTGVRVSELAGMNVDHCDFTESEVRVLGKGGKERIVPLGKSAAEAIQAYLPERGVLLEQAKQGEPEALWLSFGVMGRSGPGAATFILTPCGTPVPPICSTLAPTSARFRSCSATRACRRRSDTLTSASIG